MQHRADLGRTFAYATVPTSRYPDGNTPSGYRDADGDGDFRLIDITDPTRPVPGVRLGDPGHRRPVLGRPGLRPGRELRARRRAVRRRQARLRLLLGQRLRPARPDGSRDPVYTGRTVYPAEADGDAHSSQYDDGSQAADHGRRGLLQGLGLGNEKGFGYLRVYDYSQPVGAEADRLYRTPNSTDTTDVAAGDYVIHNNFLVGTTSYTSWYSDGVRVIDLSDPTAPKEVAYFVPPATTNPVKPSQRGVLSNTTQVWGVVVDEATGLVYASDMNSGLWILRERAERRSRGGGGGRPAPRRSVASQPCSDPKVFKAYDVRGVYPDELDEEGAYAIGRAYVEQFEPRRIAVGPRHARLLARRWPPR